MAQATKKKSRVSRSKSQSKSKIATTRARKTSSKTATSSTTKKGATKKRVAAKKPSVKKASSKKTIKKSVVQKAITKKAAVKKKATAKKDTAKKATTRKTAKKSVRLKSAKSPSEKTKTAKTKSAAKTTARKPASRKSSASQLRAKKSNGQKPKSNSKAVIRKLVTENQEHGMRLAWSFLNKWRIRLEPDDVESVVGAALVEAAIRYDKTKGAHFRTFFFYHLRGMLLKEVSNLIDERKTIKHTPSEMLENPALSVGGGQVWQHPLVEIENPEALMVKKQFAKRLWDLCQSLDELEREVIERHFIRDHSLKQIADELQYCRCHISRVKSKALSTLGRLVPELFAGKSAEMLSARVVMDKKYTGGRGRRKDAAQLPASSRVNKTNQSGVVKKKVGKKIVVNG